VSSKRTAGQGVSRYAGGTPVLKMLPTEIFVEHWIIALAATCQKGFKSDRSIGGTP